MPACARASASSFMNTDRPISFDLSVSGISFASDTAPVVCTSIGPASTASRVKIRFNHVKANITTRLYTVQSTFYRRVTQLIYSIYSMQQALNERLSLQCKPGLKTFQEKINHCGKKRGKSGIQPCQNQHIDRVSAAWCPFFFQI